jgi:hypothetical protein
MRVAIHLQRFFKYAALFLAQRNCEMDRAISIANNAAPRSLERLLDFHGDLGVILTSCA